MTALPARVLRIDLDRVLAADGTLAAAESLGMAISTNGFFQVRGHGVPREAIVSCVQAAHTFFEQPMDHKLGFLAHSPTASGFAIRGRDTYRSTPEKAHPHLKEIFDIRPHDHDNRALPWPSELHAATAYYGYMELIEDRLAALLSLVLGATLRRRLPADLLRNGRGRHRGLLRLNYYPARGASEALRDGAHVDWTPFTIIHTDTPGLEVLQGNVWREVPTDPECLTVLLGEQFEIWSDGHFKAITHRVSPASIEAGARLSIVYFGTEAFDASDDTMIIPIRPPDSVPRYAPIEIREYLSSRNLSLKRPLNA